ncbi:MAG: efflux RND transporter periplasmic adaptor subunit [Balneolales bacterium]
MPSKTSSLLLYTLCIFIFISGCGNSYNNSDQDQNNDHSDLAPTVEVLRSGYGTLPLEERLTGLVRARNQTGIYPEITAPITEVYVNNGDQVEKNDPLVKLQDTEFKERLNQAQSGLRIAQARERIALTSLNHLEVRLNRVSTLAERQMESASNLEELQAEVESAKANLELAKAQKSQAASVVEEEKSALSNTIVRATTNGVVGLRNAEVGQQVNSSTRLFEIGDMSNVQVQVVLTEGMTAYIEKGQTANLTSSRKDTVIQASITRISPFLNPVSHTTRADIEVSNGDGILRPGMYVSVDILYGETQQATLIPNNALYDHPREGMRGVYVADALGTEYNIDEMDENERASIFGPTSVTFVPVDVVAKGRMVSGVNGISNDVWIVSMGQNMLVGGNNQTHFRITDWEHILDLQDLHARDIFKIIEDKYSQPIGSVGSAGG